MNNSYGVFTYPSPDGFFNIGDYVQSLAAKQFYNGNIEYINRDFLNEYKGKNLNIIMNGWFTHYPQNWPPAENINPLFISFHLNKMKEKKFFRKETVSYLKSREPIGCRDYTTVELMQKHDIKAEYTGCLTLTLGKSYKNRNAVNNDEILLVDPIFNLPSWKTTSSTPKLFLKNGILKGSILKVNKRKRNLKQALGNELLNKGIFVENMIKDNISEDKKFLLAEEYLNRLSNAQLVITSRIHCALPCMAMGTPVVFIDSFDHVADLSRFQGITKLFPTIKLKELLEIPENNKLKFLKELAGSKELNSKIVGDLELQINNFLNSQ